MGHKVPVSTSCLLNDDLGVEHDESTEDCQTNVQMGLEQKLGSEENVDEAQEHEGGQTRDQGTSQVQILTIGGDQSGASEACKHDAGEEEGGGDDTGVQHHGHVKQGAQAEAGQEGEAEHHAESG